jgi:hypothetical protein
MVAADIAGHAITGFELAGNAGEGDEVENGSLAAVDVGGFSGSVTRNFGVVASGTCGFVLIDPTPGAENIENRPSDVTPGAAFSGNASFHAEAEGGSLRLKACNVTGGPIDPDGAGGSNYNCTSSADPAEAQAQPGGSSRLGAAGPLSSCRAECPSWPPTRSTKPPWRAPGG